MPQVIGKGMHRPGLWWAEAQADNGINYTGEFDHDPTNAEILGLIPAPSKLALRKRAERLGDDWYRWKVTRVDLQERIAAGASGLGAALTAVTNQENAAHTDYLQALNAWRQAP